MGKSAMFVTQGSAKFNVRHDDKAGVTGLEVFQVQTRNAKSGSLFYSKASPEL